MAKNFNPETIDDLFGRRQGIYGPMASDKSGDFIRLITKLRLFQDSKGFVVVVAKSDLDDRLFRPGKNPLKVVQSRDGLELGGVIPIDSKLDTYTRLHQLLTEAENEAYQKYGNRRVVFGVPEAQFMGSGIVRFANSLKENVFFLWEGLNYSFRGEPFLFPDYMLNMYSLIAETNAPERNRAICEYGECTNLADYSQRLTESGQPEHWSGQLIEIGARLYQARCALHHIVPGKEEADIIIKAVQIVGNKGLPLEDLYDLSDKLNFSRKETERIVDAYIREKQIELHGNHLRYIGI